MKNGMIQNPDGTREWYCHGLLHRTDGPAIEHINGIRAWYCHGQLHRTDGPAVEYTSEYSEWWLNDTKYTFKGWLKQNPVLDNRTRMLYILRYSGEVA